MKETIGVVMMGVAGVLTLGLLVSAGLDVTSLFGDASTSLPATLLDLVFRTAFYGAIAAALFVHGRGLLSAKTHGPEALAAAGLRRIYEREGLDRRRIEATQDLLDFGDKSNADLEGIYESIDRARFPDRFSVLLAVIQSRVEAQPPEGRV
ncbi:MAG: hypothetical protein AAGH15_20325 [Myxococcota bacterium]